LKGSTLTLFAIAVLNNFMTRYPGYQELDITQYPISYGFYTLGYIQYHRPDIELIPLRFKNWNEPILPHDQVNYDWLPSRIESALAQGKIVGLLPEDEFVAFVANDQLTKIINRFADQPVYWLTQCDTLAQQLIYNRMHGMWCRMLEIPWCLLNDCLTYYRVRQEVAKNALTDHNFLCMVNNQTPHKMQLLTEIYRAGLADFGLCTLNSATPGYEFCKVNPRYPYSDIPPGSTAIGACVLLDGVWISKNVENYLYIEQTYNHIPLVVHPETTAYQFMNTEKSIWPILLGHLFLVWGRTGTMSWIQKFYDIDIQRYANTAFDRILPDPPKNHHKAILNHRFRYSVPSDESQISRSLHCLLHDNRDLLIDAYYVQQQLKLELESARWSFGKNMYNFFVNQLRQIR